MKYLLFHESGAADDPFVLHGVVKTWQTREWRESLTGR